MKEQMLDTCELAQMLKVNPQTVRKWRCSGKGPQFLRLGKGRGSRCRYWPSDVEKWAAERCFHNTTEADHA